MEVERANNNFRVAELVIGDGDFVVVDLGNGICKWMFQNELLEALATMVRIFFSN